MSADRNDTLLFRRTGWIALLTVATIAGSFVFACATPFPALGALAALFLSRRDAFLLIAVTWAANQIIGFGFLHYPQDWSTFAWGGAMAIGALASTASAIFADQSLRKQGRIVAALGAFAAAFAVYELALFAATAFLPSGGDAFGVTVVSYILEVNVFAFAGLLMLQVAGRSIGVTPPRDAAPA